MRLVLGVQSGAADCVSAAMVGAVGLSGDGRRFGDCWSPNVDERVETMLAVVIGCCGLGLWKVLERRWTGEGCVGLIGFGFEVSASGEGNGECEGESEDKR